MEKEDRIKRILEILKEKGAIPRNILVEKLNEPRTTVYDTLKFLMKNNFVESYPDIPEKNCRTCKYRNGDNCKPSRRTNEMSFKKRIAYQKYMYGKDVFYCPSWGFKKNKGRPIVLFKVKAL